MEFNWLAIIVAALIPTAVGFFWYGPLFGKIWMKSIGMTEEKLKEGFNMPMVMIVSLILTFLLAMSMAGIIMGLHRGSDHGSWFGHGALHGAMLSIFVVVPTLIINALYDRKNWTNILLGVGYWTLTMALMGGILDAWQ